MIDSDKVKMYIRDKAELNVLLNNEEQFDDEEIAMYDRDVRDEIIIMFPALAVKKKVLPDVILIPGIISKLMESVAHQENRNQMSIGDDNVGQIDYSNKADKYFRIASAYQAKMETLAQKMCASSFYQEVWGDALMGSSDYEYYGGN